MNSRLKTGRTLSLLRVVLICWLAFTTLFGGVQARETARYGTAVSENVSRAELPPEAHVTLALIERGGPFPYPRDGVVFGNYEKRLPLRQRGYYHEYTVPTPGRHNRGARRLITGIASEYFYTDDHYRSFRKVIE